MGVEVNQTESTRNQSRATYEQKVVFLFDNRYFKGQVQNQTSKDMPIGTVLRRNAQSGMIFPVEGAGEKDDVVGVLATEVPANTISEVNICNQGHVSKNHMSYLSGADFASFSDIADAVVENITISDSLRRVGIHLVESVEHTKFDN